jgi:hypothetical protein
MAQSRARIKLRAHRDGPAAVPVHPRREEGVKAAVRALSQPLRGLLAHGVRQDRVAGERVIIDPRRAWPNTAGASNRPGEKRSEPVIRGIMPLRGAGVTSPVTHNHHGNERPKNVEKLYTLDDRAMLKANLA